MSRPKCVLHVGTMKTATSSIQSWLQTNSNSLKAEGWIYPGWPFRSSEQFQKLLLRADNRNLIISDEGLWHFGGTARSNTAEIAKFLENHDVKVVVYFRRPDEFLESWFKQGLKVGTGTHSCVHFLRNKSVLNSILPRLDFFIEIFGQDSIIVAPYETAQFYEGNIISDFIEKTGLPRLAEISSCAGKDDIRANESPGADMMLTAGILRKVFNMDQPYIDTFLKTQQNENTANRKISVLTPAERVEIIKHFRPQFVEIQSRFGTGSCPDFFTDWGEEAYAQDVSPLREIYDKYMAQVIG